MASPVSAEAKSKIHEAYMDVRSDSTETRWCIASYPDDGKKIDLTGSGTDYSEFLDAAKDDQRVYAYVRYQTGDEMSKRSKFAFITWIGPNVKALAKAKVSTDKSFVKNIFSNFGVEVLADEADDLAEENVLTLLKNAGGANYGSAR
ncbi:coactosin-like protein [Asterias rubens]|uniref:coactosin-like protein n=1 Tax=Asterias rubens TaxID=7604 RepID=UPI00145580F9|nr:coactosin-like protein [Asterias rubens]